VTVTEPAIADLVRPGAVHRSAYTSQLVFDLEMDRIFKKTWIYVCHESEIAEPGDFTTMTLGREPVIVVRDESGITRVLVNRCRHRAATVCQLRTGNASSFRCQYHGWTYQNDGTLVGVPKADRYDTDVREDLGLIALPKVDSYRGLVFASFDAGVPPLIEHLGETTIEYVDRWLDHCGGRPLVATTDDHQLRVASNWKLQVENGLDGYHAAFTHRSFFDLMRHRTGANVQFASGLSTAETKAFGNGHSAVDPQATSRQPLIERINVLPNAPELLSALRTEVGESEYEELLDGLPGAGVNIGIFPNLQLIGIHLRRIEPVSPSTSVVFVRPLLVEGAPMAFNQLRMRYHELFYGPAGFGQPDDLEMFSRVSVGLRDDLDPWIRFDRGLDRESVSDGALTGAVSDETPQREQYRAWLELMTAEAHDG
jgi:nitrite reductase/ring-hydroxylating ferredoxin subunit